MPTQSAIDMFNASDIMTTPMEAVSNGIDLSRFTVGKASDALYKKFKLPKDKPIVAYVGRLDAEKHLPVLMKAFLRTHLAMPDIHMVIVGDGTERANLLNMSYDLELNHNITFTGRVSDEELTELHKVGTVFCMPSPAELQSIATLEAMASGQPVVAVDAGALRELCQDQRNGYLCEQDDDVMIADGLLAILSDPKLRKKMSEESLAIAQTHDLQTTLKRFEEICDGLINA